MSATGVSAERLACSGSLLSRSFIEALVRDSPDAVDAAFARAFRSLVRAVPSATRGAGARGVADACGAPLASLLGFEPQGWRAGADRIPRAVLASTGCALALLIAMPFRQPLLACRGAAVSATAAAGLRWCLVTNGAELALLDCARSHARRWLLFDLAGCAADLRSLQALWSIVSARCLSAEGHEGARIESLIARSEADLRAVRAALQAGVERAALTLTAALDLGRSHKRVPVADLFEQALTVIYRILFLQFAEARGLVPVWHPTYRRAYTIASLRDTMERRRDARGLWEALQAIARLAHRGAEAGDLTVVPFNGRLFSPAHAPTVAARSIPDASAAALVTALTTIEGANGRPFPIPYSDLGVEQLGSIYERVLEFAPERAQGGAMVLLRGTARKRSGSFYTPRTLTEFVVHRALEPLTRDATPEQVLDLRVLDPAMGSGAFLVAACRHLARAYEQALIRSGEAGAADFSARERAAFRRLVAQRCLYGVDINPMAVQLGRLSLWLCSLSADRPLTFLDHRLRVGNSVLGTSLEALSRRAPGGPEVADPTLFGDDAFGDIGRAMDVRLAIAAIPDDSVAQVRQKEMMLSALESDAGPLSTWRRMCDLWCAWWFWPDRSRAPSAKEFGALCDSLRGDRSLWSRALADRLETASELARDHRFFHWQLEFPEVFLRGGFDAIVGNPPWDMVRGEAVARQSLRFTRDSGVFRLQSTGHANLYQLFLERSLQLVRPGGRVGVVMPWGLATDEGSASLRRHLLDRCTLDDLAILDNAAGIFPIHRALKFCSLSFASGGRTDAIRYRPAVRELAQLEGTEAPRPDGATERIELPRALIESLSGSALAVPHVSRPIDVQVLERIAGSAPAASDPSGWGVRFSRELNASDDKRWFRERGAGYPVISGRHIAPFRVDADASPLRILPRHARALLGDAVDRPRLAYRDVAGAGNRVTLIGAIVPPRVVTTHTLFCLRTPLDLIDQWFLCAVLNSYVANYVIRTRVGTHVTTALVHALPVPRPSRASETFARIVRLARAGALSELHAAVALLYGLDGRMWQAVLDTFPLVPAAERDAARLVHALLSAV